MGLNISKNALGNFLFFPSQRIPSILCRLVSAHFKSASWTHRLYPLDLKRCLICFGKSFEAGSLTVNSTTFDRRSSAALSSVSVRKRTYSRGSQISANVFSEYVTCQQFQILGWKHRYTHSKVSHLKCGQFSQGCLSASAS